MPSPSTASSAPPAASLYYVARDIASLSATFYLFHNYVTPETRPFHARPRRPLGPVHLRPGSRRHRPVGPRPRVRPPGLLPLQGPQRHRRLDLPLRSCLSPTSPGRSPTASTTRPLATWSATWSSSPRPVSSTPPASAALVHELSELTEETPIAHPHPHLLPSSCSAGPCTSSATSPATTTTSASPRAAVRASTTAFQRRQPLQPRLPSVRGQGRQAHPALATSASPSPSPRCTSRQQLRLRQPARLVLHPVPVGEPLAR